ncbi:MAG: hypothetical protein ACYDHC_09725 [Desulfuromonadaceae bacterium]
MTHDPQNEIRKASLIGQILSMETLLLVLGIAVLTYGIANSMTMSIFWGCVIIPGVFILHHIRKTNWTKHWQEMEAEHKALEEREAQTRSVAAARKGVADGK